MERALVVAWCGYVGLFGLLALARLGFTGDALASAMPFVVAGTLAAWVAHAVREPAAFTKEIVRWTKAGIGTFLAASITVPSTPIVEYPGTPLALSMLVSSAILLFPSAIFMTLANLLLLRFWSK